MISDLATYVVKHSIVNEKKCKFDGSPVHYVEFATYLKNCCCASITDPVLLYSNLLELLTVDAYDAVTSTRYLPVSQALECA